MADDLSERPVAAREVVNYPQRQYKDVEDVCDGKLLQEDFRWRRAVEVIEGPEGHSVCRDSNDENQGVKCGKYHIPAVGDKFLLSGVHRCDTVSLRQELEITARADDASMIRLKL